MRVEIGRTIVCGKCSVDLTTRIYSICEPAEIMRVDAVRYNAVFKLEPSARCKHADFTAQLPYRHFLTTRCEHEFAFVRGGREAERGLAAMVVPQDVRTVAALEVHEQDLSEPSAWSGLECNYPVSYTTRTGNSPPSERSPVLHPEKCPVWDIKLYRPPMRKGVRGYDTPRCGFILRKSSCPRGRVVATLYSIYDPA